MKVQLFAALMLCLVSSDVRAEELRNATRLRVVVTSSRDQSPQDCILIKPDRPLRNDEGDTPLLVSLHSWSADLDQRNLDLEQRCVDEGWYYLHPNFRGPNQRPEACGSELAQQDILDAVAWAQRELPVDDRRIYLTGASGGGHMTMLMAGRHPRIWAAASAWVGISDLAAWHARHRGDRYGEMMRKSCGGAPGDSAAVDAEYRRRSPLSYLRNAKDLPLDIAAGIHDGHSGSVPVRHSLAAFNAIAEARGDRIISEREIQQLSRREGRLLQPLASDRVADAAFGREIYLRRQSGACRVTLFEGGHERLPSAAIAWLKRHRLK